MSEFKDKALESVKEAGDGRNPVTAAGVNGVIFALLEVAHQQQMANKITVKSLEIETGYLMGSLMKEVEE